MKGGPYFKRAVTYTIERVPSGHIVFAPDGTPICAPVTSRQDAEALRSLRQADADKRAKRGPRPCLSCTREFESEGVHNRLCGTCRQQSLVYAGPAASAAGRVRRAAGAK